MNQNFSKMNLQYISDSSGKTTGVFIPISEWNELKTRYEGIDQEQIDIPTLHQEEVQRRLVDYRENPSQAMDFNKAMEDIEDDL